MSAAILFSKPSPFSLEKGRLFGSAQTRSSRACAAPESSRVAASAALRELEDIERPSLGGDVIQVAHGIDEAERRRAVARVEIARHDRAGPTADTRQDRHILLPVGSPERGRLADDP